MSKLFPILIYNFLGMMAMMAILPVIGPIIREIGLEEWHAGLIVGVSGIFWMLFSRFWGEMSDRKGRRVVLLITSSGFMLFYFSLSLFIDKALSTAWSIPIVLVIFIILRSLMGLFFAGVTPVSSAYIADMTSNEKRTSGMALLGASSGFAMISGPAMSGIFAKHSLVTPLYIASTIPTLCILIILFAIPKVDHLSPRKNNPIKLSDKRLRLPILSALLASSSVYTANMCIGFYGLDVLQLDPQTAAKTSGYAMGAVGISMIIIQIIISKLNTITPKQWLKIGAIVAAIGFAIVARFNTVYGLYSGYAIAALGIGAIFPAMQSIASKNVQSDEQGIAAGSVAAAQGFAMVIAPILSTLIYEINPLYPYLTIIVLLSILLFYTLIHKD